MKNRWHFSWRSSTLALLRRAHQKLILDVKGACLEALINVALQTNKNTSPLKGIWLFCLLVDFSTTSVVGLTT